MRISDWSSDVCSSDLCNALHTFLLLFASCYVLVVRWCAGIMLFFCPGGLIQSKRDAEFPLRSPVGWSSVALDAHGDAHDAADAQGGADFLGVPALHFIQQGPQHAGARGAGRLAEGHGAD